MPRPGRLVAVGYCLGLAMLCVPALGVVPGEMMLDLRALPSGPLPGQSIGLLLSGPGPILLMRAEGRYGPSDAVLFSVDREAYRWMYLPTDPSEKEQPLPITFQTPEGERTFGNVVLATQEALSRRHIAGSGRLVQLTINRGIGSAETDRFLATEIRAVDGTDEFPAAAPLIDAAIRNCNDAIAANEALRSAIDELKASAQVSRDWAVQSRVLPYLTWLSQTREIELVCEGEMTAGEANAGIGTVPNLPGRQVAVDPSATYGRILRARLQLRYVITRTGRIQRVSETTVEKSVSDEPPPGGPAAPRIR